MACLLNWLGWILIAGGAIVLGASPWIPLSSLEPFKNAVPAGVLVALAGHLFSQARGAGESAEKRSQFYLDSCVRAYEEARNLLIDGNNDRAAWIAAGRALMHAKELAGRVTVDAHLRVLELHKLKYRGFFHDVLASKQPAFFYGAPDYTSVPLDKAAAASTAREERGGRTITSTLKELSEKSIYAVWQAAQWPHDYKDPLDHVFFPEERDRLLVLFPGLHEYFEHKERWDSASGQLFPRNRQDAR